MFVSGETAEPTVDTTSLIESVIQQQVVELLSRATALAARRGVRTINTDDLIFLIRNDKAKVSRLRTFLSWKDVRKSAKDSEEKTGGDRGDQLDDFDIGNDPAGAQGNLRAGGPSGGNVAAAAGKNRKAKVGLPWDVSTFYSEQVPERDDEEDEDEEEMTTATLQRLKNADERTKNMTPEEYLHWSECRQASFTFRKGKRFREWAGIGIVTDSKPNDDIIDILGFLTFEMVQTLTEEALRVKSAEDASKRQGGDAGSDGLKSTNDHSGDIADDDELRADGSRKRKRREPGLFDPPEESRSPISTRHVHEAFRRLQKPDLKSRYMAHIAGGKRRTALKLVRLLLVVDDLALTDL